MESNRNRIRKSSKESSSVSFSMMMMRNWTLKLNVGRRSRQNLVNDRNPINEIWSKKLSSSSSSSGNITEKKDDKQKNEKKISL
ncbi:hypothetical protein DERP_011524 [Dermatophagoides pteronyssinus]|uniref:Uncharacterized protein n=1 Tax=Dermatophagoides pteronyssinus TaxID=6956 RepID=A0ABQ8JCQ0_DERPT|nr:hypothetical protein DERP_011524 [Dermatophagoides pteronyssinus]